MILKELKNRLGRSQKLYHSLVKELDESNLSKKLSNLPSNTIGQQLWCVIGARTSYLKAAKAGKWSGFECPLDWEKTAFKVDVMDSLEKTYSDIESYLNEVNTLGENESTTLLDLLEHEVQHHGQLVRYIYGLKLEMPSTWKERYNLD
ncbi:MAG: hypothetical protein HON90_03170 [Halobacteriovoraceae bacterium]|jgi:hypothetical protein|nr:hypothetical protein [Halobacteriovoraceae bacterium]